ncbi:MAG: sulfite exporter TauE/SafE family protein [Gaiellaceae bacterium]
MGRELALVAVGLWCFLVAALGSSIGLVLGTIRLPVLLLVAPSPAAGAGANVGISAVSAAVASIAHLRAGRVNWRLVAWMAPPSIVGALIGGFVAGKLPSSVLLAVIGALLVFFGLRLLGRSGSERPKTGALNLRAAVASGLGIGLLGGLVGLILGTLRVPALIRYVGETAHRAVGTNLVVGLALGVAGVVGHTPSGVDWTLLLVGSLASIPGALVGSRLTGRLSERQLLKAIGIVLVVVGAATFAQAFL